MSSLLLLHDLHPVALDRRIEAALARVREEVPDAGPLHVVGVEDGVVKLRPAEPSQHLPTTQVVARAIERVMLLDHLIAHRAFTWLGAEQDKVAHFLATTSIRREELPRLTFGRGADVTVRYFPDKLPVGVSPDGRSHVLLYLLSQPLADDFRMFLRRHAELLRGLPTWSIRLLVPTGVEPEVVDTYEAAFREELGTPLHPTVANELRWFYQSADVTNMVDAARLRRARRAFGAPRFRAIRKAWLQDGDRVVVRHEADRRKGDPGLRTPGGRDDACFVAHTSTRGGGDSRAPLYRIRSLQRAVDGR